jgi:predicted DNA-binding transcriptional regulator YafY
VRFFRADRIQSIDVMADSFTRPETLPIHELIPSDKAFHGSPEEVLVVRYSPRIARWIAEREGTSPDPDGYLTMQHRLGDDHWAVRHVLQYGPEAEVLSPRRIREQVTDVLKTVLR